MARRPSQPDAGEQSRARNTGMPATPGPGRLFIRLAMWTLVALMLAQLVFAWYHSRDARQVAYSEFRQAIGEQRFERVVIGEENMRGELAQPAEQSEAKSGSKQADEASTWVTQRVPDDDELVPLLEQNEIEYSFQPSSDVWTWLLPLGLGLLVISLLARRGAAASGLGPQGVLGFGKSQARIQVEPDTNVTFDDVAGVDEALEELEEIVSFLKEPERYRRIGAKIPKGVLLVGPPGTGKTLLARAVAGHAGVPFFSLSGSEFMEMFVGVGAARVRDLFQQARQRAPAIIFIDELDALAKARGAPGQVMGGHDEREQTLNQLLNEMDGFDPRKGLIVLAATNRPEVIDQALLRPGRFDRQVLVDRPDRPGRERILRIHARGVKLGGGVDLAEIAKRTPGFAGAELASVINEAALLAVRRNATQAEMRDFEEAIERVVAGLRRKNQRLSSDERERVAFHEAGHAVVATALPRADRVQKVSIVSRGFGALGFTWQLPEEDRSLLDEEQLRDRLTVLFGGRAAEAMCLASLSTGAADDLRRATELARAMVTEHGMSGVIGPVSLRSAIGGSRWAREPAQAQAQGGPDYSESTAKQIDQEIRRMVDEAERRAGAILRQRRGLLEAVAARLIEKEVVGRQELEALAADVERRSDEPGSSAGAGLPA